MCVCMCVFNVCVVGCRAHISLFHLSKTLANLSPIQSNNIFSKTWPQEVSLSLTLKYAFFKNPSPHNAGERKRGTEGWTLLQRSIHPPLTPLPPALSFSLCILRGRSSTLGAAEPSMANTKPGSLCSNHTGKDGRGSQFEALLLDELEVEATAVLELPVVATDLRMWGSRKGSLASWWTSIRSSLRYTKHRRMKACNRGNECKTLVNYIKLNASHSPLKSWAFISDISNNNNKKKAWQKEKDRVRAVP